MAVNPTAARASRSGRLDQRDTKPPAVDNYVTPGWCVRRLMEQVTFASGEWLEPCAGAGAIIRATGRKDAIWTAWEIREEERHSLCAVVPPERVVIGDFLGAHRAFADKRYSVAITNPPFRLAQQFIDACLTCADTVVMLLRLSYLASISRWEFMTTRTPDVYVLPNRPSFVDGRTDATEYGWFVWTTTLQSQGKIKVLGKKI